LAGSLGLSIIQEPLSVKGYEIYLVDRSKLVAHKDKVQIAHIGSFDGNLIAMGVDLSALVNELYKNYGVPFVDKTGLTGKYDFLIIADDATELPAALEGYGFLLKKIETTDTFYRIE
jgi:hypothetical protein